MSSGPEPVGGPGTPSGPGLPAAVVWVDGRLVGAGEPALSALDHGLLVGDGVFESLRVVAGVPVAVERHLERLAQSAARLGIALPPEAHLREGVGAVLRAGRGALGRLRLTVTSGPGPLGSTRGEAGPTTVVIGTPATSWPPVAHVVSAPWPRNERSPLAGVKSTSYAENVLAMVEARRRGADEAVFANTRGELCEGTGSNVFVARGGRLLTPPLASGCLAGITRALVLEAGLATEEVLDAAALAGAEEAFLTSSTRGVHPIATVDGRALAACPGPLTEAAADALVAAGHPAPGAGG